MVDDIILGKENEQSLNSIISRVYEYEDYVKKIIQVIEKKYVIKKYPVL